jgi:methyl-accepting chemotaxis protein
MSGQAEQLLQTVAFFKVEGGAAVSVRPKAKAVTGKPAIKRAAPAVVGNLALASSDPDLNSFAKF